jgi:hypothetical protein
LTYNTRNFRGAKQFGTAVVTPKAFLEAIGVIMSTVNLNLPELLYKQVCKLAQQDGISLNQFIATAVAEAERSASVERRLA